MAIHSVGDQARAFVLQNQTARLRNTLHVLTDELSTGTVADRAARLSGNTTQLHHFETQIGLLTEYRAAGQEAATFAGATQQVLGALRSEAADFGSSLMSTAPGETSMFLRLRANEAQSLLASAIGRLNTEVAGLHLFSGQRTDQPPLAGAQVILDQLTTLTSGLTTAADIETAVASWFDAPPGGGGYLDLAYQGAIGEPRIAQVAEDRTIAFGTSAASPAIRDLLMGLSLAAIADSGALSASGSERHQLVQSAGGRLMSNDAAMLGEMGRVGLLEALADRFSTEHANAIAVAEIGRSQLITADPFQTATALQQVQTQMETLYTLTARLSGLKLVDYLR